MRPTERLLSAFSPRRNLRALFVPPAAKTAGATGAHLGPLDGLRALSILWVVLFHAGWYSLWYIPRATYASLLVSRLMLPVWRGDFGVDVFFVLSGFLIAGILIDERARYGRVHIPLFQLRRFLRTWPALAVAVLADVLLFRDNRSMAWFNLVYLSNFVPVARVCMGWTWSLSIEEQFYVFCPWLLRAVGGMTTRGVLTVLGTIALALCVVAGVLVVRGGYHALDVEIALNRSPVRWQLAFDELYTKPWMRAGPLLVGVASAFVYRDPGAMTALARSRAVSAVGLVVALVIGALATHWPLVAEAPRAVEVAYLASYRLVFGLAVGYVMLFSVSAHPLGHLAGKILSHRLFYPIGQLSFSAYLVNPMVTTYVHRALALPVAKSHTAPMLAFIPADIAATFVVAALLHLLVERPGLNLRPRRADAPVAFKRSTEAERSR
jgi:peptidoglycan/LPS O-acetylase OafA/YrhL